MTMQTNFVDVVSIWMSILFLMIMAKRFLFLPQMKDKSLAGYH